MGWLENLLITSTAAAAGNLPLFALITLIGTALWGDFSLIFLTIFAVQADIPLAIVFFFAFFGTLIGDSLWFLIGVKSLKRLRKIKKIEKHYNKISKFLESTFKGRHLLALTVVKFLYGTRVITIFYLADERMKYIKFLKYNLFATFFWVIGVGAIGWLAGIGFSFIISLFKNIQLALSLLAIFFLIINFIQRKLNKELES